MKELENINPDKLKVADERPVKKEVKFLGSMKQHAGHTMFELDLTTRKIVEATFESVDYAIVPGAMKSEVRKKLLLKEKCMYASALNIVNAKKKFLKMLHKIKNKK